MLSVEDVFLEGPQEAGGAEVVKKDSIENSFTRSDGNQLFLFFFADAASKIKPECFQMRPPAALPSTPPESVDDSEHMLVNELANDPHVCGLVYDRADPAIVRR